MFQDPTDEFARVVGELSAAVEASCAAMVDVGSQMVDGLEPLLVSPPDVSGPWIENLSAFANSFDVLAHDAFESLPPRAKKAAHRLAENGWYIGEEMPLLPVFEVSESFATGKSAAANDALCDYMDQDLGDLEARLTQAFPRRGSLISQALDAHRRGHFGASIPLFMTQADGICFDVLKVQLYSRKKGHSPKDALPSPVSDSLLDALLHPLRKPYPISSGPQERANHPDWLNRHAVLHGESCDYDTRENSCRALSLLGYVGWILASVKPPSAGSGT